MDLVRTHQDWRSQRSPRLGAPIGWPGEGIGARCPGYQDNLGAYRQTLRLFLRDDGLWRVYGRVLGPRELRSAPPPQRLTVVEVACRQHGTHLLDGERLARVSHLAPRRIDVADLAPIR
jgi:hypothetical protein